jgi:acyl-coenzyme A thioesterase PaaI-like protein
MTWMLRDHNIFLHFTSAEEEFDFPVTSSSVRFCAGVARLGRRYMQYKVDSESGQRACVTRSHGQALRSTHAEWLDARAPVSVSLSLHARRLRATTPSRRFSGVRAESRPRHSGCRAVSAGDEPV